MDKLEELGGGTFGCFNDFDVCCKVALCGCGTQIHYIDTVGRYALMGRQENVDEATKCCGLCNICYITNVEEKLNMKLGGSPDWWRKCMCYYCCGSCRVCMFIRAMKELEKRNGQGGPAGAPQSEEMEK
jgi:hypothetical protein